MPLSSSAAFVGLGAMGYPMAKHLHSYSMGTSGSPLMVYNRNPKVSEQHSQEHGSKVAPSLETVGKECGLVFICLPNSAIVAQVVLCYLITSAHFLKMLFRLIR